MNAALDDKLAAIMSKLDIESDVESPGFEGDDAPGGGSVRTTTARLTRKKLMRLNKDKGAAGFKRMEKVRREFRRTLMEHISRSDTTRLVYPNMEATWVLLVASTVKALNLTPELAKDFCGTTSRCRRAVTRLRPSSAARPCCFCVSSRISSR